MIVITAAGIGSEQVDPAGKCEERVSVLIQRSVVLSSVLMAQLMLNGLGCGSWGCKYSNQK